MRWSLIKAGFSRCLPKVEPVRASPATKRERGIWQRRYWEHQIRDATDLARHVDYIHYNPVKHSLVSHAVEWPHSTFHEYIKRGMATRDWGGSFRGLEEDFGER
jgi:putative transposase